MRDVASAAGYALAARVAAEVDGGGTARAARSWVLTDGVVHGDLAPDRPRVEPLDGQFGWIAYDADRDAVSVAADPFGMYALYVAEREGKTYVANSALALAKHLRAQPSRLGLQAFLCAGYQFGRLTNWEGIERLEPASRIVFGPDGARRELYWRPEPDAAVARMGLEDAVAYCNTAASTTFSELLSSLDGTWADLTGGYDTRMLALLLRDAGVRFRTNTVGDGLEPDVRIARRLAQVGGWEWSQLALPDDWDEVARAMLPASVAWSDGQLDVLQLARVLWGHREKSRTDRSLLIGGGGEHFRGFTWQQEFLNAGRSTRVNLDNWIDMRLLRPIDVSVFASDPIPEVRADFGERMSAWAAPYSSELNTTQLDVMYAYKMTGHFGAYLSAAGAFVQAQLPFYFRPVFSAAFSTNYRHRNNHRLMRHMIVSLDARIAALETASGGPAEPWRVSNIHRFLPYYARTGRRAANKLTQKALGRPLFPSAKPRAARIDAARRAVLGRIREDGGLDHATMRSAALYDRRALDELLARAARPDFGNERLLGRILTIELTLRAADAALER